MSTTQAGRLAITGGRPAVRRDLLRHWPEITDDDRRAVTAVLETGPIWAVHGPQATALEKEFAEYCGVPECQAVTTGTAAVQCIVTAAGVGPGDEVIVPAFGYIASVMPIVLAGATPVFCDIDPETFTLDVGAIRALITPRTRAIMAVHLHGLVVDMAALEAICREHRIVLLCDAAQAAGATEGGRKAGAFGYASAFSLNGQKPFQAGEGGLITCTTEDAWTAVHRYASLGEDRPRTLKAGEERGTWARWIGDQFRLNEMTAALARSQLRRLDEYLATARRNADILAVGLSDIPGVKPPRMPPGSQSSHYRYRVVLDANACASGWAPTTARDKVLAALLAERVPVDRWQIHPLPAHPALRRGYFQAWHPGAEDGQLSPWDPSAYPRATALLDCSFTLGNDPYPLHVQSEASISDVVTAFHKVFGDIDTVLRADTAAPRLVPGALPGDL